MRQQGNSKVLEYQLRWADNPSSDPYSDPYDPSDPYNPSDPSAEALVSATRKHSYQDRDIYRGLMSA